MLAACVLDFSGYRLTVLLGYKSLMVLTAEEVEDDVEDRLWIALVTDEPAMLYLMVV